MREHLIHAGLWSADDPRDPSVDSVAALELAARAGVTLIPVKWYAWNDRPIDSPPRMHKWTGVPFAADAWPAIDSDDDYISTIDEAISRKTLADTPAHAICLGALLGLAYARRDPLIFMNSGEKAEEAYTAWQRDVLRPLLDPARQSIS